MFFLQNCGHFCIFFYYYFHGFLWLEIGEFQVIFPIPLQKAGKFSKVQSLRLEGGNCFVSAPILLVYATIGKRVNKEIVSPYLVSVSTLLWQMQLYKFIWKISFSGNRTLKATKEGLPFYLWITSRTSNSILDLLRVYRA